MQDSLNHSNTGFCWFFLKLQCKLKSMEYVINLHEFKCGLDAHLMTINLQVLKISGGTTKYQLFKYWQIHVSTLVSLVCLEFLNFMK